MNAAWNGFYSALPAGNRTTILVWKNYIVLHLAIGAQSGRDIVPAVILDIASRISNVEGGICMKRERRKGKGHSDGPSVEEYLRLDENEKDIAIEKAVIRLQTRIHEILYLMEAEIKEKKIAHKKEGKKGGKESIR